MDAEKKRIENRLHRSYYTARDRGELTDAWPTFRKFRDWAVKNGYGPHSTTRKINKTAPFCPENVVVLDMPDLGNSTEDKYYLTSEDASAYEASRAKFVTNLLLASPDKISSMLQRIRGKTLWGEYDV